MSMFNLKKISKKEHYKPYQKYLEEDNESKGTKSKPSPGSIDYELNSKKKDTDSSIPFNTQLNEARKGESLSITESQLNNSGKGIMNHRSSKAWNTKQNPINLLSEANDQKKYNAFRKETDKQKIDNSFWTKDVGKQKTIKTKKIIDNKQKSQLQNSPDNYSGLDKTMPISTDINENKSRLNKKDKISFASVESTLRDADSMLFHIYASAAKDGRELNDNESQMVIDINSGKLRILNSL